MLDYFPVSFRIGHKVVLNHVIDSISSFLFINFTIGVLINHFKVFSQKGLSKSPFLNSLAFISISFFSINSKALVTITTTSKYMDGSLNSMFCGEISQSRGKFATSWDGIHCGVEDFVKGCNTISIGINKIKIICTIFMVKKMESNSLAHWACVFFDG